MIKIKALLIPFFIGLWLAALVLQLPGAIPILEGTMLAQAHPDNNIIRVAPSGADSPDCGAEIAPCASIQYAVDQATAGDEIRVAEGTYSQINTRPRDDVDTTGQVTQIAYISTTLTLRGGYTISDWEHSDPVAHQTKLDAQGLGRVVYVTQGVAPIFENLLISGGNATNLGGGPLPDLMDAGGGVYAFNADVTISNCIISTNTASSSRLAWGGGIFLYESDDSQITSNIMEGNIGSAGSRHGRGGALGSYNSDLILFKNTVRNNTGAKISGGWGGGIYLAEGIVELTENVVEKNKASTSSNSAHIGHGGGIIINGSNATLIDNTIWENQGSSGSRCQGGGAYLIDSHLEMTGNTVANNIGSTSGWGKGGGLFFSGGDATLVSNTIISNTGSTGDYGNGGGMYFENVDPAILRNNVIKENRCSVDDTGIGGGLQIEGSNSTLSGNWIQHNTAGLSDYGRGGGIYLHSGNATLAGNTIVSNTAVINENATGWGGGMMVSSATFTMTNNLLADNHANTQGGGLYLVFPTNFSYLYHTTIADNLGSGAGIYVNTSYFEPNLINTIISGHQGVGITVTSGSGISLDSTLWYRNGTDIGGNGTFQTENDYYGDPAFLDPPTWNYHIAANSAAIDKGVATNVNVDIDNQARPTGSAPDLGADEYLPSPTASASKTAFAPQWEVGVDAGTGLPYSRLRQRYLFEFSHSSPEADPLPLTLRVTDTLPAELDFSWAWNSPPMDFQAQGQTLLWKTQTALPAGKIAQIVLASVSDDVEPQTLLTNTITLSAGAWYSDLQTTSLVPSFPPQIISPGRGEICPPPSGSIDVVGLARPLDIVEIYEDGNLVTDTTADAGGIFTATYSSGKIGGSSTSLTAVSCMLNNPSSCSDYSKAVALTPPTSLFCPQLSTWEDTPTEGPLAGKHLVYRFRDRSGRFVSNGWDILAPFSFSNTELHLYARGCPAWTGATGAPDAVWVTIKDKGSFSPISSVFPWYEFSITAVITKGHHDVSLNALCLPDLPTKRTPAEELISEGDFGISQNGLVFDSSQGLEVSIPGVTVTLMVSQSEWGGWVPWPAHMYAGQQNPQVTGGDGLFAFLAPADTYHLQAEALPGYQSWRSPVFTDVTQINVPYTPWTDMADQVVVMGADGLEPATVIVPAGGAVEWIASMTESTTSDTLISLIDNPIMQPRTRDALDPIISTLGFDGGRLAPGQVYRRTFTEPGVYPYTDGAGHEGQVEVTGAFGIYLPLVLRN